MYNYCRLILHHNNVRTITVVVVVIRTLLSIFKNAAPSQIRTFKCAVQMITNLKKLVLFKKFLVLVVI